MDDSDVRGGPSQGESRQRELAGTIIAGRYRIMRKLGEGAMGSVYLGEHLQIGRKDAIKVLRGRLAHDAASISRFRRGARNLSAIRHPNVCTLYDYGETADGSPFLALEFVTGETLLDLLGRERRLEPARAFNIARQAADALQAAHDVGIVHRDLKPSNIMLERHRDGSDFVKVVDFDIAKGPEAQPGDELTALGMVVGTPQYMSPEQLMGERLDGRSDIFSLGIVLFRMLTGGYPFRGASARAIMTERITTPALTLAQVSPASAFGPAVQSILDRSLARDRDERYQGADQFAADVATLEGSGRAAGLAHAAESLTRLWKPEPPPTVAAAPTPTLTPGTAKRSGPDMGRRTALITGAWAALSLVVALFVILSRSDRATLSDTTSHIDLTSPEALSQPPANPGQAEAVSVFPPVAREEDNGNASSPVETATTAAVIVIRPEEAEDVLVGLITRLPTGDASRYSTGELETIRDTAEAIYGSHSIGIRDRGLAAYLIASYHDIRGDSGRCRQWINNALSLDPGGSGFRELLGKCGGAAR